MNCYLCEKLADSPALRYGVVAAVGVCHDCGIGVCLEHSYKDIQPGSPLLCLECAEYRRRTQSEAFKIGARCEKETA
jgi:hypothetical protein